MNFVDVTKNLSGHGMLYLCALVNSFPSSRKKKPTDPNLPYRYDARLAEVIEAKWQEKWRREGTYHTDNPSGDLSSSDSAAIDPAENFLSWICSLTHRVLGCMSDTH